MIVRFFNRIFSRFVDRIICVSRAVEDSLVKEGISRIRLRSYIMEWIRIISRLR